MSTIAVSPSISVIVCTRNRADSLRLTLECLASANRDGVQAEIIVVDNGGHDDTERVARSFSELIPIRYLYEPAMGVYGKSHALNRALDAGGLGEIIAVLDDDMSPHPDWIQKVMAACKRWPDKHVFTGDTYVLLPGGDVPGWAKKAKIHSLVFSAGRFGSSDSLLQEGRWFTGCHFWFRSLVLQRVRRFKDIWNTEPDFQLDLSELGFSGMATRDAAAGHRVQPCLLQRDVALDRAKKVGVCNAWLRLQPYRKRVKQARLFHEHPVLARLFCLFNCLRWRLLHWASYLYPSDSSRFEHCLIAVERMTTYRELLRAAGRLPDYAVFRRVLPR
jgi:glycosyltransferase involved in cell wall biosynthesis